MPATVENKNFLTRLKNWAGSFRRHPVTLSRIERLIDAYHPRLSQWQALLPAASDSRRVAVLICPWLQSAVPLFSLECALSMRRDGMDVVIFWDHGPVFPAEAKLPERLALEALLEKVSPLVPVCHVPALEPAPGADWGALAEKILNDNAIARAKGEDAAATYFDPIPDLPAKARDHLARVQAALEKHHPAWVFVPGGVFSTSAMYREVAQSMAIPCGTFDSDEGVLFISTNGVATHHSDIPRAATLLKEWLNERPAARAHIETSTKAEMDARMAGADSWGFQIAAACGHSEIPCDVLVPLNLRWDTAALARERIFPNVREWMLSIARWAQAHPELHVCFRQHPCERHAFARGSDDMAAWVKSACGESTNIHFIAAADTVSTYDLLRTTKALIPHTSTIALEAAIHHIPTVLATRCYYQDFGFTWSPENEDEFHQLIGEAVAGRLAISPDSIWNAQVLYFITQICAPLKTFLTPIPKDFQRWVKVAPEELWDSKEMLDLRRSFLKGLPLGYLRSVRFCESLPEASLQ